MYCRTIFFFDDEDSPLISEAKEIFNELAGKRLNEITKLDEKVNRDDLIYRYKGRTPDENFDKYDNALDLINKIKNGQMKLADVKNDQVNLRSSLREIKKWKQQKKIKGAKKRTIQYWRPLQSKERGY